jgi:hypothetical protein
MVSLYSGHIALPSEDQPKSGAARNLRQCRYDSLLSRSTVSRSQISKLAPQPPQSSSHSSGVRVRLFFKSWRHSGHLKAGVLAPSASVLIIFSSTLQFADRLVAGQLEYNRSLSTANSPQARWANIICGHGPTINRRLSRFNTYFI